MPKISIIIPVYNVEKYLKKCIDSVLAQTFTDFECILVDDGSWDNSPAICDEYAGKDKRVKVIHKENGGVSSARNAGLDVAQGEWIGFVDSDDWIEHDMLEKMYMKAFSENYDMVWCDYYNYNQNSNEHIETNIVGLNKYDIIKKLLSEQLHGSMWNKITKKNLFKNNNIIFPPGNMIEDLIVTIKNVYYANKIGHVNDALYHYIFNPYSLTQDIKKAKIRAEEYYKNLNSLLEFLNEKFKTGIINIEPEFSFRVNICKISMLRIRELRDIEKILLFYPDSHKHIFNKKFDVNLLHKIFLFLATKRIIFPYYLLDILFPLYKRLLRVNI